MLLYLLKFSATSGCLLLSATARTVPLLHVHLSHVVHQWREINASLAIIR
jgi:hypothetical protein